MKNTAIQHFDQLNFKTYYLNFDEKGDSSQKLLDILMDSLLEFVFGINYKDITNPQQHQRFFNACEKLYKASRDSKREGDLGEIILHSLLRTYLQTIPFTGRFYFAIDKNTNAKSFDIIHVLPNADKNILVLGESKMYKDAKGGLDALVDDIKNHFQADYTRKQFVRISESTFSQNRNVQESIVNPIKQKIDEWELKLRTAKHLDEVIDELYVPLLCTYSYDDYKNHNDVCEAFIKNYEEEMNMLHKYFFNKEYDCPSCLNILLMLFPLPCKDKLIEEYYKRIDGVASIE